jgi:hypothetical protein
MQTGMSYRQQRKKSLGKEIVRRNQRQLRIANTYPPPLAWMVTAVAFSLEPFRYSWLLENVIPEISIALASARAISDIFRGMLSMHIDSEVKDAIISISATTADPIP